MHAPVRRAADRARGAEKSGQCGKRWGLRRRRSGRRSPRRTRSGTSGRATRTKRCLGAARAACGSALVSRALRRHVTVSAVGARPRRVAGPPSTLRLPPSTTAPTPRSCDRRGAGLIAAACGAGAEIQGRADGGRVQQNGALQCGWGDPAWVKSARFVFVRVRHPPLAQRGFVAHLTAPCGGRATARMTRIRTQTLEPAGQRPPPQERATQTTVTTRTDYGGALYNGMNDEYTAAMFCRGREWASPCFGCVGSASCLC